MASIFGSYTKNNEKRVSNLVNKVNALRSEYESITHDQSFVEVQQYGAHYRVTREQAVFMARTFLFRKRLRNGESLEDILPEAMALCREATRRKLGMFQYDVQVEAAIAMLGRVTGRNEEYDEVRENVIAEMKTGEGKTLVQLLIGYLEALDATKDEDPSKWKSVHIMTSNDALAKRDAQSNGQVFGLLGFSCSFVPGRKSVEGKSTAERNIYKRRKQMAYGCDIVYSTATNIAFDYLDDNTVVDREDINITRPFGYAIIDEADDLLIDQANNPLKISGRPIGLSREYEAYLDRVEKQRLAAYKWAAEYLFGKKGVGRRPLTYKIYDQYEESKQEEFYEDYGYVMDIQEAVFSERVLDDMSYGVSEDIFKIRYLALQDCIKAIHTYSRGKTYELIGKDGKFKVVLVDQNTGRLKHDSKYNDGMQEAIEAIETYKGSINGYEIIPSRRSETLAMCTYPDFLSLYKGGVCGMTGTSAREEFMELYGFETYDVRTRRPNIRVDEENEVYATTKQKNDAILREIISSNKRGQPVLVGTSSVKESRELSELLKKAGIKHRLLNATNAELENEIILHAGEKGAVTIATNMAGRGVDIKLGKGVKELGGLYVIGTTRNKSLRIDRQLRGRAGRQGDPGKSKYFSSLEDELVRLYIDTKALVKLYNKGAGQIVNGKVINAVNKALKKKDEKDKHYRKVFEKLNIVYSRQKNIIYQMRRNVLDATPESLLSNIGIIMGEYATTLAHNYDVKGIKALVGHLINVDDCYNSNKKEFASNMARAFYKRFRDEVKSKNTKELVEYVETIKKTFLNVIDVYWHDYMKNLEAIKSNVANNYSVDTIQEYERQANMSFGTELIPLIYNEMLTYACNPNLKFGEYEPRPTSNDGKGKALV